jgi:hypothetical protein
MAQLDFPIGPSIGDRYPTPSQPGKPQYLWDGEKWTTAAIDTTVAPPASALPLEDNATPQVGVTTKYAREDHVHPSTAVKYSAQTLTAAQAAQSRTNVYAAPLDALAYSGMQINGSMEVSQENGTTGTSTSGAYFCDGWRFYRNGTMVAAAAGATTAAAYFPNFSCCSYSTVSTAQTTLGAADYTLFVHFIEGYRVARLGWGKAVAQPITLGFWTAHVRTGLYSGTVRNAAGRSYAFTYTHAVSGVAQYNTVTIPGDVTGTWASDNTTGMRIAFAMACGSTSTAPSANTWLAGDYFAAPGQINAVAATSDVFRITGVVVLPGIEAPSAERSALIMRPYDQELVTCRRYFQHYSNTIANGQAYNTVGATFLLPISPMRAVPTLSASGNLYVHSASTNVVPVTGTSLSSSTTSSIMFNATVTSGLVTGDATKFIADSFKLDARL